MANDEFFQYRKLNFLKLKLFIKIQMMHFRVENDF